MATVNDGDCSVAHEAELVGGGRLPPNFAYDAEHGTLTIVPGDLGFDSIVYNLKVTAHMTVGSIYRSDVFAQSITIKHECARTTI